MCVSPPQGRLKELGFESTSIHHYDDPVKAVKSAQARVRAALRHASVACSR
jgi:hypothetical protein